MSRTVSPPRYIGEAPRAAEQLFNGHLDRSWGLAMAYLCSGSGNLVLDRVDVDFDDVLDGASWHRLVPPKICLPPNLTIIGTVNRGVVQGDPQSAVLFATLMGAAADRVVSVCAERVVVVQLLRPNADVDSAVDGEPDVISAW